MAVTVADLQARVETDLDNTTLQRILDANVEQIARSAGNAASQVETVEALGADFLALRRRVTTVSEVKERRRYTSTEVTLAADDYRMVGAYRLLRLADGTNPAAGWGQEVKVTYTPEVDSELRDRATLDLSQIDIEFRAFEREKVGDWEGVQGDWKVRRREVLRQIREGRSPVL